jgi:hypothetical protein
VTNWRRLMAKPTSVGLGERSAFAVMWWSLSA